MSQLNDNLARYIAQLNSPVLELRQIRGSSLKARVFFFLTDKVFSYTILAMLAKSILFLGLINNDNAASFSISKAFSSFSSPPPLIVYMLFDVILLSFSFLFRGRLHFWLLVLGNFLFSLLLVADLMYYRGFGSFLSPYLLSQSSNLDSLFSSIVSMLRPIDLLFVIDIIALLAAGKRVATLYAKTRRGTLSFLFLLVFSISSIYALHYAVDVKWSNGNFMLFRVAWVPNQTMSNLSPLGYHMYDLYNYYNNSKPYQLTAQEKEDIQKWFAQKNEDLPPNQYADIFKGQNLIFIQVESLETVILNKKVSGQEITPNLNRLMGNSLYFSNFYEQVYNGSSSDADLMANTSVYPVRSGSTFFRFPNNTYNSLPKLLRQEGYSTLAIHSDKGSYWNWMPALTSIGFEETMDAAHFEQDEKIGLGLSDRSFFNQVAPVIDEQKQPFYTFMITLTSHNPFDLPEKYRGLELDDELDKTKLGGYFQGMNYTDQQIGAFLDNLDKRGLLENTVVVIYGDHAGVHKYYNDEVKQIEPRESWWWDDSKRIPMLIYHKGMAGQEIKTTGGQVDILPTVSYLMGIDEKDYENTAMGRNLMNTTKDYAILAYREYVGSPVSEEEQKNLVKGIDISDLIIRSNYFKQEGYK